VEAFVPGTGSEGDEDGGFEMFIGGLGREFDKRGGANVAPERN